MMELFRAFGRLAVEGADEVDAALSDAEASGASAADALGDVQDSADNASGALSDVAGEGGGASDVLNDVASSAENVADGVGSAAGTLTKFVTGPLAALAATAAVGVTQLGNFADEILDTERAVGMSSDAIQRWRILAERAGTDTDVMTRAAERLNRELGATGEVGKDTESALNEIGLTAAQLANTSVDDRMRLLVGALSDVDSQSRAAELGTEIFGRQWLQIAPILADSSDEMKRLLSETDRFIMERGDLGKADDFRVAMVKLRQEITLAWREIALELIPYAHDLSDWVRTRGVPLLESLVESVSDAAEWFSELSEGQQGALVKAVAFAAALGPLLGILSKLIIVFAGVMKGLAVIIGVMGSATAAVGGFSAIITTALATASRFLPILLRFVPVVGAMVTAITLAIAIFRNWDTIIEALAVAWEWFVGVVKSAVEFLANVVLFQFEMISEGLGMLLGRVQAVAGLIADAFGILPAAWSRVVDAFSAGIDWIVHRFVALRDTLFSIVTNIRDGIINAFRQMTQWVADAVQKLYDATIGRLRSLYNVLVGNSIIPDLRDDVVKVMWDMAEGSEDAAGAMAGGVAGELSGVSAPEMAAGGGGGVSVDMRGSIFRDDKEMDRRLRRSGVDLGGF